MRPTTRADRCRPETSSTLARSRSSLKCRPCFKRLLPHRLLAFPEAASRRRCTMTWLASTRCALRSASTTTGCSAASSQRGRPRRLEHHRWRPRSPASPAARDYRLAGAGRGSADALTGFRAGALRSAGGQPGFSVGASRAPSRSVGLTGVCEKRRRTASGFRPARRHSAGGLGGVAFLSSDCSTVRTRLSVRSIVCALRSSSITSSAHPPDSAEPPRSTQHI